MKNIKFYLILFVLLLSNEIFSQKELTLEIKQWHVSKIDTTDLFIRGRIINTIREFKIIEAREKLEDLIWLQNRELQYKFLNALSALGSAKTEEYALILLDSLENDAQGNQEKRDLLLDEMVATIEVLFGIGNYSKTSYIFELLERDKPDVNIDALSVLPDIINNVPEYNQQAKEELLRGITDCSYTRRRERAVTHYEEFYKAEAIPAMIRMFMEDSTSNNRFQMVEVYFKKYNDSRINNALRERLYDEQNDFVRYTIAEHLLNENSNPSNYEYVRNYLPSEQNYKYKEWLDRDIIDFKSPKPDSATTTSTMLDTLISYINQSYSYNWLKNEAYKGELLNKTTTAENHLLSNDLLSCRNVIELFQNSVEQVFIDSANSYPKYVSDAGYKFLFYQAQYILDKLPEVSEQPTAFDPIAFVDTLLSYNTQCLNNGWLSATWVHTVLKSSLDNARLMLTLNQPLSGMQIMQQFNSTLDSYKTSNFVTTEGCDLLKPNSDYLITKLDSIISAPQNVEAFVLLDTVFVANETCNTEGWYSATWVYTNLTAILNNAKTTLEQNNPIGCKGVIDGFIATLDGYKASSFVTDEGYNYIKPKCLDLIEELLK